MRTLNSTIMAQLAAKTLRPFLILDMDIDGTHYRYTDADVPIGVRYKYEAITGGPTVHGLSLADGAAFARLNGLDLSPFAGVAGVRTPCKLILTDSAGKQATGWIAEADAAEALGAENCPTSCCTDPADDQDNTTGWSAGNSAALTSADNGAGGKCLRITENGADTPYATMTFAVNSTPGDLIKLTYKVRPGTENGYNVNVWWFPNAIGGLPDIVEHTAAAGWTTVTQYLTALSAFTNVIIYLVQYAGNGDGTYLEFDDVSIKNVTHAGADGVHIVSAQNGSIRNWTSIEAGFNYNDTAYTAEIANVRFSPRGAKIEPIRYSLSRVIDSMKLQIDNLDDALTAAFVDGTPNGSTVTLQMVLFDSNYEMVAAPVTVFEGTIDGWDLDEEKVSLTVASELVRWNQRTLAKHSASCRWKEFKGTECAYAGAETWCDRTYTRCAALSNQVNFGGFRWLPSIVDKEIWWGRSRAI